MFLFCSEAQVCSALRLIAPKCPFRAEVFLEYVARLVCESDGCWSSVTSTNREQFQSAAAAAETKLVVRVT